MKKNSKYQPIGIVGEGVYGEVLKCRDKETGEFVAIKRFKESEDDEVTRKTSYRELKVLKMLKHDNIVLLKDFYRYKKRIHLVFEFVDQNLLEVLESKPNGVPPDLVRKYIFQLCKAIDHCHNQDIIHRDIKPENLLVSFDHQLKLCDFGFARTLPVKPTVLTEYVATRWYRSPELLLGGAYGRPVDIWAIGCIMGELTDGQPLFPGSSDIDQLYVIQKVLGQLTPEQNDLFQRNPRFIGLKFPEMQKLETLEKRYLGKLSKNALNFLKSLLKLDANERISSLAALQHPYFEGLNDEFLQKMQQDNNSRTESASRQGAKKFNQVTPKEISSKQVSRNGSQVTQLEPWDGKEFRKSSGKLNFQAKYEQAQREAKQRMDKQKYKENNIGAMLEQQQKKFQQQQKKKLDESIEKQAKFNKMKDTQSREGISSRGSKQYKMENNIKEQAITHNFPVIVKSNNLTPQDLYVYQKSKFQQKPIKQAAFEEEKEVEKLVTRKKDNKNEYADNQAAQGQVGQFWKKH